MGAVGLPGRRLVDRVAYTEWSRRPRVGEAGATARQADAALSARRAPPLLPRRPPSTGHSPGCCDRARAGVIATVATHRGWRGGGAGGAELRLAPRQPPTARTEAAARTRRHGPGPGFGRRRARGTGGRLARTGRVSCTRAPGRIRRARRPRARLCVPPARWRRRGEPRGAIAAARHRALLPATRVDAPQGGQGRRDTLRKEPRTPRARLRPRPHRRGAGILPHGQQARATDPLGRGAGGSVRVVQGG